VQTRLAEVRPAAVQLIPQTHLDSGQCVVIHYLYDAICCSCSEFPPVAACMACYAVLHGCSSRQHC
jgi:uncharacterized membrane protein (DUF2068 family)